MFFSEHNLYYNFFLQVKNKFFWENQSIFKENSVSKECSKFYNRKLIVTH